jgi:hypothetical protein
MKRSNNEWKIQKFKLKKRISKNFFCKKSCLEIISLGTERLTAAFQVMKREAGREKERERPR